MFDLKLAIREFRSSMASSLEISLEDLDELEDHLHAGVAHLRSVGLTEEEAFLVTARRLGNSQDLIPEFRKVKATSVYLTRVFWMFCGVTAYLYCAWGVGIVSMASMMLLSLKGTPAFTELVPAMAAIAIFCCWLAFLCARRVTRRMLPTRGATLAVLATTGLLMQPSSIAVNLMGGRIIPMDQLDDIYILMRYSKLAVHMILPVAMALLLFRTWKFATR